MARDVMVHTVETLSAVLSEMRKEFAKLEQCLETMKAHSVEQVEVSTGQAEFDRAQNAIFVYAKYLEAAIKLVRKKRGDFGLQTDGTVAPRPKKKKAAK